ncbi:30S ribosomal protein S6 [Candidatus Gracilibacteria bacterium GN02-872]|nr:30S ribosomal protein S6 [Candidatus Gracilibacteria bacterium GN02-872]
MNKYELMLILNSSISEEDRNHSLEELRNLLTKNEVKIEKEDIWGDKKLAYKINKSDRGFYVLFSLEMNGKLIKELSKSINLNKAIIRYMFAKLES